MVQEGETWSVIADFQLVGNFIGPPQLFACMPAHVILLEYCINKLNRPGVHGGQFV